MNSACIILVGIVKSRYNKQLHYDSWVKTAELIVDPDSYNKETQIHAEQLYALV